jgi:uncharacterized protein YukE
MAKAVVDPAEVRRFAQDLKRFTEGLGDQMNQLNARHRNLAQTWRDQEHKRFTEEFEQCMRQMARFRELTAEHVPFLVRKAQRAEDYLNQR